MYKGVICGLQSIELSEKQVSDNPCPQLYEKNVGLKIRIHDVTFPSRRMLRPPARRMGSPLQKVFD